MIFTSNLKTSRDKLRCQNFLEIIESSYRILNPQVTIRLPDSQASSLDAATLDRVEQNGGERGADTGPGHYPSDSGVKTVKQW
jgi:hypothetical protein